SAARSGNISSCSKTVSRTRASCLGCFMAIAMMLSFSILTRSASRGMPAYWLGAGASISSVLDLGAIWLICFLSDLELLGPVCFAEGSMLTLGAIELEHSVCLHPREVGPGRAVLQPVREDLLGVAVVAVLRIPQGEQHGVLRGLLGLDRELEGLLRLVPRRDQPGVDLGHLARLPHHPAEDVRPAVAGAGLTLDDVPRPPLRAEGHERFDQLVVAVDRADARLERPGRQAGPAPPWP